MKTWGAGPLLLACALSLVGCRRGASDGTCSAETLDAFTPSIGVVSSRMRGARAPTVEHDVWTGEVACGATGKDPNCEGRARVEAQRHVPPGGGFTLAPGKTGEPDKWKGSYAMGTPMPARAEHEIGIYTTMPECSRHLDALPRGSYFGASCKQFNGRWRATYSDVPTTADFAAMPTSSPVQVGVFDTQEECTRSTTFLGPTGAAALCEPAGTHTFTIRAFRRDSSGAPKPMVTLRWAPPPDVASDAAMVTVHAEAKAANVVILGEPPQTGSYVEVGCP